MNAHINFSSILANAATALPSTSDLATKAMLVDFSASQWTARKIDKAKSAELTTANQAKEKSAHISKKLVQSQTLAAIATLVSQAREFHYANTLPWLDNGARILPAKRHPVYLAQMEKFEEQFWPLVDRFEREYPAERARAAERYVALGQLFNHDDYPQTTRIRQKFGWRNRFLPLPAEADFRVDIGQAAIDRVRATITETVQTAASNAVRDMLERTHSVVATMVEKLTAFEPSKSGADRGIFRDSLVTNVRELVDLLPDLNFTADPRIDQLVNAMQALCEHDAEDLRASDNLRTKVLSAAQDIAQSVSDFMA